MKKHERLGLALLNRVIAAPDKVRLPNNPLDLLTTEYHDDCLNRPSACAPVHRPSGSHRGVVRRPGQ
jgi:hypothetical protein